MEVKADYQQIVGQVKERNKLYKAIIEIDELTNNYKAENRIDTSLQELLNKINRVCAIATEGII